MKTLEINENSRKNQGDVLTKLFISQLLSAIAAKLVTILMHIESTFTKLSDYGII